MEKIKMSLIRRCDGTLLVLVEEGEMAGFRANEKVRLSQACRPELRSRIGIIVGFDNEGRIWIRPDGSEKCCYVTAVSASATLIKII